MKRKKSLRKTIMYTICVVGCFIAIATIAYSYFVKPVTYKERIIFGIEAIVLFSRFFLEDKEKREDLWLLVVVGFITLTVFVMSFAV